MFKKWLLLMAVVCFCQQGFAQYTKYIVRLTDKGSTPFSINNPSAFLSPRAIERRTRYSIPIDSADLPVTPRYIDSIRLAGNVTILNVSKWLNQVAIQTSDALASSPLDLSVGGHTSAVGHPDGERHGISPRRYDSTKAYMMRGG